MKTFNDLKEQIRKAVKLGSPITGDKVLVEFMVYWLDVKYIFDDGYTFVFYNAKNRYCSADGLCFVHELQNAMKVGGLLNWANEFKIKWSIYISI